MTEIKFTNEMGVELIEHMGSDETVARAARVSTGRDQLEQGKIKGLINYLVREGHVSTLEHCVATLRFEVPIFVAREMMRHRTMSYNEISGRYAKLEPVFYVPSGDRPLVNEGSGAHPNLSHGDSDLYEMAYRHHDHVYHVAWSGYMYMLKNGVATEVARNVLPVGVYTRFYATANLNNWFKFLWLRNGDNGAPQYEIVQVAKKVEAIISDLYPLSYKAWKATLDS